MKSYEKGKDRIISANEKRKKKNDTDLEEGDQKLLGSGEGTDLDQDSFEMSELKSFSRLPSKSAAATASANDDMRSMSKYSKLSGEQSKSYEQEMKEVSRHLDQSITLRAVVNNFSLVVVAI